jgi:gliding motility-associated-like protein
MIRAHNAKGRKNNRFSLASGYLVLVFILLNQGIVSSQIRCNNPPVVELSQTEGTACFAVPIVINDNTFGGSATLVRLTSDGNGSVIPSTATSSPFSFTYQPDVSDAGHTVTITVTTNNPLGKPCKIARATFSLTVVAMPSPPIISGINQPTCTSSTGSVDLTGLPAYSSWTVTINPGGMNVDGSGSDANIPNLPAGSYSFSVSVSGECVSGNSETAVIGEQPLTPSPPVPGPVTNPTCAVPSGSLMMYNLPPDGTWTLTRYPGTITMNGSGTSVPLTGLSPGTYNYTVMSQEGCVSTLSPNVTIDGLPEGPPAPIIGTIIQPTFANPTGSVAFSGLPVPGTWTLIRYPGNFGYSGSGSEYLLTGLEPGTYTFMVRNSESCLSDATPPLTILVPVNPSLVVHDPDPVCSPATADLTAPAVTEGSDDGLILTYWTDSGATLSLQDPAHAAAGMYYIKGTTLSGFFEILPVTVRVYDTPVADAGPDQKLAFEFSTVLEARLGTYETGTWQSSSEGVFFSDEKDPHSSVNNLDAGTNVLEWIVSNSVCPADTDRVSITTGELVIPTLITPNGDARNEYFRIDGLRTLGIVDLTVFDRKGTIVYRNEDYDNTWNGVDYNDKPLYNDTYFFVIKSTSGRSYSGYVVLRK